MSNHTASGFALGALVIAGACGGSDPGEAGADGIVELTGLYRYMADAAVFEDCATGERYPVLIEAEHLEVERAYLLERDEPGAPLLLTARFTVVSRAPEPGMPERSHLRIVEFVGTEPGGDCPG